MKADVFYGMGGVYCGKYLKNNKRKYSLLTFNSLKCIKPLVIFQMTHWKSSENLNANIK